MFMSVKYKVTLLCVCCCAYSTPLSLSLSLCVCVTCALVQALSGDVIVLIDPFSVTFEVDLGGWRCPAAELDRPVLDNESILGLEQELWERFCRR